MKKTRLFLTAGAALGVLTALLGAREARAGANTNYAIQVTIYDDTTSTSLGTTTIYNQGADDTSTSPNSISVNSTAYSGAGPVSLTGLGSTLTENSNSTALLVSGTAQLLNTTNTYTITVTASAINLTTPAGGMSPLVTQSSGANLANTSAGGTQSFTGYYGTNTLFATSGTTPGAQLITFPSTTNSTTDKAATTPYSAAPPSYFTPYGLTDTVVITLSGNANNPQDAFHGTTTITVSTIPEPASLVMLLTGMPVPLIVLGMLRRRRKAAAAKD